MSRQRHICTATIAHSDFPTHLCTSPTLHSSLSLLPILPVSVVSCLHGGELIHLSCVSSHTGSASGKGGLTAPIMSPSLISSVCNATLASGADRPLVSGTGTRKYAPDDMKVVLKVVGAMVRGAVGPRLEVSLHVDVGKVKFVNKGFGEEDFIVEPTKSVAAPIAESSIELAVDELALLLGDGKIAVPIPAPVPIDPGAEPRLIQGSPATL